MSTSDWKPRAFVAREQFIAERCPNRSVLHLGCIGLTEGSFQDRVSYFLGPDSLHTRITKEASHTLGVDLDSELVEALRSKGRDDVAVGNVERLEESSVPQDATFDLILAADIIEHLSNPGLMLTGVRRFLSSDGELVVTTPNAFGLPNQLRYLFGSFREGHDHVHSYSFLTLGNLLARHGFRIRESYSCYQEGRARSMNRTIVAKSTFALGKSLLARWPKLGGTILIVATKEGV